MDHAPAFDLRRNAGRALTEQLVLRARWLAPDDAELVRLHFGAGLTAVALARVRGEAPRRVRARLRRLGQRMVSPRFEAVMRHLDAWPKRRRAVAHLVVLQGQSSRVCAVRLNLSLHQVRCEMRVIEALVVEEAAA